MTAKIRTVHDRRSADGQAPPDGTEASPAPAQAPVEPLYERVDIDRYVVLHDGPVGYVEHVSPVFVCYVGHPYARADEVGQVHDFHNAVQTVLHRAVAMRRAR